MTSLVTLTDDDCWELLEARSVGRVAVGAEPDGPLVVPVNYVVDNHVIVFRTAPGTKLRLLEEHPASFQVDDIDPLRRTGWSVLVRGVAFETARHPPAHEPQPWTPGPHDHWMRILPKQVTGRRIVLDEATSTSGGN